MSYRLLSSLRLDSTQPFSCTVRYNALSSWAISGSDIVDQGPLSPSVRISTHNVVIVHGLSCGPLALLMVSVWFGVCLSRPFLTSNFLAETTEHLLLYCPNLQLKRKEPFPTNPTIHSTAYG